MTEILPLSSIEYYLQLIVEPHLSIANSFDINSEWVDIVDEDKDELKYILRLINKYIPAKICFSDLGVLYTPKRLCIFIKEICDKRFGRYNSYRRKQHV